jgi:uncharacterized membrane protein
MKIEDKKALQIQKFLPYILLIGGIIGFLASFILMIDTIKVLQNPGYTPACNINPIISCGSVMKTDQSSVFGFSNSLLGIGAFAAMAALGAALLAGARFNKWLWLTMQGMASLGMIFVHWLIFESLYRIGSLCPFCMVVWSVTIPTFWYLTLYNLNQSRFSDNRLFGFAYRYHIDILIVWLLIILTLILNRFWYYWSSLLGI